MDLSPTEVALKYKQLRMVEDAFRSMKSLLDTRPIYHKCEETIREHVFCSFFSVAVMQGTGGPFSAQGVETGIPRAPGSGQPD